MIRLRPTAFCLLLCCSAICCLVPAGCLKHSISITSDPPGALVWLNDVEAGRTPLETDFTFHGVYDVRLEREGYEPIVTKAKANPPIQEIPGIDLLAAAAPTRFNHVIRWHYVMQPVAESKDPKQAERDLITRARAMRTSATPPSAGWIPPAADWVTGKSLGAPAAPQKPGK